MPANEGANRGADAPETSRTMPFGGRIGVEMEDGVGILAEPAALPNERDVPGRPPCAPDLQVMSEKIRARRPSGHIDRPCCRTWRRID